jgi:hypothetical protein
MMTKVDFDQFSYSIYCIEQDLRDIDAVYNLKQYGLVEESSELTSLQEGVADTIMTAIRSFIAKIQEVWNKFKSQIVSDMDKKFIENNAKYLNSDYKMNMPIGYNKPDMEEYEKFMNMKMPTFTKELLKDLDEEEIFIRKYLPLISSNKAGDITKNNKKSMTNVEVEKILHKIEENEKVAVDKQYIDSCRKFLLNYKAESDKIAEDIRIINSSSRNMEEVAKNSMSQAAPTATNTANTGNAAEAQQSQKEAYMNYYFSEADDNAAENNDNNEGDKKESFDDANKDSSNNSNDNKKENTNGDDNEEKDNKKTNVSSQIGTYIKIFSNLLSAKMNLTNKVRKADFTIISHFVSLQKGNEGKEKENAKSGNNNDNNKTDNGNNNGNTQNNNGASQVNI